MTRPSGEYLSLAELADYFGTTIRHARLLQRSIPYTKVGGLVRFAKVDVEEYARRRRVEPRRAS